MRQPDTIFGMLHDRGTRKAPITDVYRQLYNPLLYLRAYAKISPNAGAMTKGSTEETADAMTLKKIEKIIEALRQERYRWTPVRRSYVPKKNGKRRALGLPSFSDKLLQEVIRSLLEAYYEPQFSEASHGFRPGHGCHTALSQIQHIWKGCHWFIEGDIKACFDQLDQTVMLDTLAEMIPDNRFLRLIKRLLQAGYLEQWRYHPTLSGAPQGGIVSPILANIYLNKLDLFVSTNLIPVHTQGQRRRPNPAYERMNKARSTARKQGDVPLAKTLLRQAQQLPTGDPNDPTYRRLRYIRYADDVLLGFTGPKHEAEEIKAKLATFLHDSLKLELSQEKTLITHASSNAARFLGYDIQVQYRNDKLAADGRRRTNAQIALRVPKEVVEKKSALYLSGGKPRRRYSLASRSDYTILNTYQAEYRGLVQYYLLANNVFWLNRVEWAARRSLLHTLAHKYRSTIKRMVKRYHATIETPHGPRKGFEVIVQRGEGKKPLVARFGGIPLIHQKQVVLADTVPPLFRYEKKEVIRNLVADRCQLCGRSGNGEVHQIRKLADLDHFPPQTIPPWAQMMKKRRRKTLIVCQSCHRRIHAGSGPDG